MRRRNFLKWSATAALPLVIQGIPIQGIASEPLSELMEKGGTDDRVLVIIQLTGGNDGLNMVIPIDQYDALQAARSNILLAENKILNLSGNSLTGLHPAMPELRSLYDSGKLSIIQSVSYPNPDFSHFRATDIWLTAANSNEQLETGWMGRYLNTKYPDYPTGYPNTSYPDPPAIQIGAMVSPAFQGTSVSMGMSITDPTTFYQFVNGTVDAAPNTPAGHELTFVRLVAQQTQAYSGSIKSAASNATNKSTLYPTAGSNSLADQLKIVAQLIAGGLKTKVYMVSLGGFDTHSAQVVSGAAETGNHANLLQKISQAIAAFQDDLKLLSIEQRVLGMTFSEFGRRIKSNASLGTDHGSAAPMFLFGSAIKGGVVGHNPVIPVNAGVNDNVSMQFDFRSVYATILKDWFGLTDPATVLNQLFPTLDLISGSSQSGVFEDKTVFEQFHVFPNPSSDYIQISLTNGLVPLRYQITTMQGVICKTEDALTEAPTGNWTISVQDLKQGAYILQVWTKNGHKSTTFTVVR